MNRSAITPKLLLEIVKEKHELLPGIMIQTDIDCWIVFIRETASCPDSVQNLVIGGDVVWESAFIFSNKNGCFSKTAIVGALDVDAEDAKGIWDEVTGYKSGISNVLSRIVTKINPKSIALNFSEDDATADGLSYGMFLKISKILPSFIDKYSSAKVLIQKLRSIKTSTEISLVKDAIVLAEEINVKVQGKLKPGMSESDIQKLYHEKMEQNGVTGAWQKVSCPAVDAGPDKMIGHIGPGDLKIKKGHTLHVDFGVQLNGYCSDIQRMCFFGRKHDLPDELDHAFKTVHGAITRASEFIKPGVQGFEVDKVARDFVVLRGYDEYEHALGHQMGIKAHDGGALLAPKWERYGDLPDGVIQSGNIFTLELYVKTANFGMVSLEEDIIVTPDGCLFLTPRQDDWIYIEE
jgi:Xaa-Pro aminopeptidase